MHTGFGLTLITITTWVASASALRNEVLRKIISKKSSKYKKQPDRAQQTISSFDSFLNKSSQGQLIDRKDNESVFSFFFNKCLN